MTRSQCPTMIKRQRQTFLLKTARYSTHQHTLCSAKLQRAPLHRFYAYAVLCRLPASHGVGASHVRTTAGHPHFQGRKAGLGKLSKMFERKHLNHLEYVGLHVTCTCEIRKQLTQRARERYYIYIYNKLCRQLDLFTHLTSPHITSRLSLCNLKKKHKRSAK